MGRTGFNFPTVVGSVVRDLVSECSAHQIAAPPQGAAPGAPAPPYTQATPEQLQQLVAPIALYPDSLVAQILAASTFPDQVVEADRWMQEHPGLQGDALGQAVDQQPWDPSVKALTAFPSVLGNMDKNLSWTSSLGDAYYNQQQDVMDAVQVMRQRAQQAGNLRTTPQQVVTTQGPTIVVQPANPEVVYVPAYDPWVVYGGPIMAWPGWYPYPGIWYGGPYLSFGVGFGIGFFGGFGWGWNHWGAIGTTIMQPLTAAGTTPAATRFTTGTPTTEVEGHAVGSTTQDGAHVARLTTLVAVRVVEFRATITLTEVGLRAAGLPAVPIITGVVAREVEFPAVPTIIEVGLGAVAFIPVLA